MGQYLNFRLLMFTVILIGFSFLALLFIVYDAPSDELPVDDRQDLIEVLHASTDCSRYWRGELFEMKDDHEYDYENDPIFIECSEALELQKMNGVK